MQVRTFIALLMPLLTSCGPDVEFALLNGQLAKVNGKLCLLVVGSTGRWNLELIDGHLKQAGSCQPKHPGMFALSAEQDTLRPLLPGLKGLDYRGAWSMSPNRKLVAVAVSPEKMSGFSTRQFAIVDIEKKQVVTLSTTPPNSSVGHMAWSPDSALLALTYIAEHEGACGDFSDRLGSFAGHPVRCVALGIEVLDSRGTSLGRTLFARNVPNGGTGVAWVAQ